MVRLPLAARALPVSVSLNPQIPRDCTLPAAGCWTITGTGFLDPACRHLHRMICRLAGERSNLLVCKSGLLACQQLLLRFRVSGRRCNLQCEDAVQAAAIADRTLLGSLLMSTSVHLC